MIRECTNGSRANVAIVDAVDFLIAGDVLRKAMGLLNPENPVVNTGLIGRGYYDCT